MQQASFNIKNVLILREKVNKVYMCCYFPKLLEANTLFFNIFLSLYQAK